MHRPVYCLEWLQYLMDFLLKLDQFLQCCMKNILMYRNCFVFLEAPDSLEIPRSLMTFFWKFVCLIGMLWHAQECFILWNGVFTGLAVSVVLCQANQTVTWRMVKGQNEVTDRNLVLLVSFQACCKPIDFGYLADYGFILPELYYRNVYEWCYMNIEYIKI